MAYVNYILMLLTESTANALVPGTLKKMPVKNVSSVNIVDIIQASLLFSVT
jgi:hypothetical protein